MMFKVLVVDDETLIQEGIAEGIDWDRLECSEPYLADNGLEAIDVLEKNDVDIVITDIKMPGMNGLELAEWIYANRKGTYVIILSGYDDFKYAQNALRFGVTEYILKPTRLEEVGNSIEKVKRKINDQNKINEVYNKSREIIECSNRQAIIDSFIFDRICNTLRVRHVLDDMCQSKYIHKIILLQVYNYSSDFIDKNNYIVEYVKYMEETVGSIMKGKGIEILIQYEKDEILIYLSSDSALVSAESLSQTADSIVLKLKEETYGFMPFDIVIGKSRTDDKVSSLKSMYLEAVDECDIEKQRGLPLQRCQEGNKSLQELLNSEFQNHLSSKNSHMLMKDADEVYQKCLDKTVAHVKGIAIEFINYALFCCGGELSAGYTGIQRVYEDLINSHERKQIFAIVKDFLKKLCQSTETVFGDKGNSGVLVSGIIDYIRRNFFNDLSLENVSAHFYISPGHLSRLLRKNCNTTFLDLLTRIRIENAKVLLKNRKYKAYEVGTMIGFNDSKYFSRVFKKFTGKTPSEFK